MYLIILLEMFVLCRCMVSNASLMSSAVPVVRCGGFFALNPAIIMLFMWCSALVVDLCFPEAVLVFWECDVWKYDFFKYFGYWRKKCDRSV